MYADDYASMHNQPANRTMVMEIICIFIMLLWGLYTIRQHRRYHKLQNVHVTGFYRYLYLAMLVNIIGYTVITLVVFSTRKVVGYTESEIWNWLDSQYSYSPVYAGEGWAVAFIYLCPLVMATRYLLAGNHTRKMFGTVLGAMYPWIIMATYLGFFAVSLFLPHDVKEHIFNRPVYTSEER